MSESDRKLAIGFCAVIAVIAAIGATGSFLLWTLVHSSWIHEGGDHASAPDGWLTVAIICAAVTLSSTALGFWAARLR